jgi:hypothetical protein
MTQPEAHEDRPDTASLASRLRHVYWIGGASGAGKSTIARRLAGKHGLRLYSTDEAMGDHAHRWRPEGLSEPETPCAQTEAHARQKLSRRSPSIPVTFRAVACPAAPSPRARSMRATLATLRATTSQTSPFAAGTGDRDE